MPEPVSSSDKKDKDYTWLILAIVGGLVLLAILIIIIVVAKKKHEENKKEKYINQVMVWLTNNYEADSTWERFI